jgi:hypothetical protein
VLRLRDHDQREEAGATLAGDLRMRAAAAG